MQATVREVEQRLRRLMVESLRGQEEAYGDLLRELTPRLRGYFRRRMRDHPDDCEDLVQVTLMAIHTRRHTYDEGQPFTAWAHAIARYKLIDWRRRHGRREALQEPVDERAEDLFVEPAQDAGQAHRDVLSLLADLPSNQSEPIRLTKLEGLSVAEAAVRAGMSVSAIKVGVHRGLKALAARIKP